MVTASADKTARVWNAESGELLQTFTHAGVINAIEISAAGKFRPPLLRTERPALEPGHRAPLANPLSMPPGNGCLLQPDGVR